MARKKTAKAREKTKKARGDCFQAAGAYLFDQCAFSPDCGLLLVHAEVAGQGPLAGVTFGHAWVLDGDTVIDLSNGRNIRMSKGLYYAFGQVDRIGNVHVYAWSEARERILEHKTWGPWDLKTRSGL